MKLIFCLSAGRTGTAYLAEVLKENLPHPSYAGHELLPFGVHAPEVGHMMAFNNEGNTTRVKDFWEQKFRIILSQQHIDYYAETSHLLMKAGLLENAAKCIPEQHEVIFIILKREDWEKTLKSYHNRYDFYNKGNIWMWYLDPGYKRNLVSFAKYNKYGIWGTRFWYLTEMYARYNAYQKTFKNKPNFKFYEIELNELNDKAKVKALLKFINPEMQIENIIIPPRKNQSIQQRSLTEDDKQAIKELMEMKKHL
jgi:hypothetical protein